MVWLYVIRFEGSYLQRTGLGAGFWFERGRIGFFRIWLTAQGLRGFFGDTTFISQILVSRIPSETACNFTCA